MDKLLFTPGPLGVSLETKEAMLRDVGSRDVEFISLIRNIRSSLLKLAKCSEAEYTCIPMQGSGTFSIEAVLSTFVPRNGKVLILENGAYGRRQATICKVLGIDFYRASFPENHQITAEDVRQLLAEKGPVAMVTLVHCETSSGIINKIEGVGNLLKDHNGTTYFVDAMSSFGAYPVDMKASNIDFLVSSANKCIEGVPGFGYALCNKKLIDQSRGNARSYALDLVDQYDGLEKNGQFRFTPPTHTMLAFNEALEQLEKEGGVNGRAIRYQENRRILKEGMLSLGFEEFLTEDTSGYIITSFNFHSHPNFNFRTFYEKLSDLGYVIYPGKVLDSDCFRIGNIGHLYPENMRHLLENIKRVMLEMCGLIY